LNLGQVTALASIPVSTFLKAPRLGWATILAHMGIWVILVDMKTTIDLSDNLLRRAKELARRENLTLKELAEEGLEMALRARERRAPYQAKPVVFRGKGLSPEFQQSSWSSIRDAAYEGRGG